ncbi:MAG: hypothetical protein ABW250_02180 [Pyrinomonadaceae bacterium]
MATILLIEEDDDARPILRHNLMREGYKVLVAVDEASALDWLAAGRASADLILVNLVASAVPRRARATPRRPRPKSRRRRCPFPAYSTPPRRRRRRPREHQSTNSL